jgi:hypothetical protein
MNRAKSMVAKRFLTIYLAMQYAGCARSSAPPLNRVAVYRKMPG